MRASQGTSDGQNHERIQRAGKERDTSGHLLFTESRRRGSPIPGERLARVTAQGPRTAVSSTLITKVFATNYKSFFSLIDLIIHYVHCSVLAWSIGLRRCNLRTGQ